MNRNLLLIVATVVLVVIGGGVLATGASDDLFQDDVEIDDDAIVLEAADSPEGDVYADTDDGELSVDIHNVNQLAETRVDNVFTAEYRGDEEARIHVEDVGDDVTIFEMESGEPVEGEENAISLLPDDGPVTFGVDIVDDEDAENVAIEEITVVGQVVNPAFQVVDVEPVEDQVVAGDRVTVEAEIENSGSEFQRSVGLLVADRGDDLFDASTVRLGDDETTTAEFEYRTRQQDVGELGIGVDVVDDVVDPDDDLAATVQVTEPAAEFDVEIASVDGIDFDDGALVDDVTTTAGSAVTVTAEVENAAATGTDTVELLADGTTVDDADVTLDAGETATVDLTYVPTRDDEGDVDIRLETATDDSADAAVTVEEPTEFEIEIDDVTDEPVAGEDVLAVDATVSNDGDDDGIARVWLEFEGDRAAFLSEPVDASDDETVTLTTDLDERDAGDDSTVTVFTEDEEATEEVDVLAPAAVEIDDVEAPDDVAQGVDDELTVEVDVANEDQRGDVTPVTETTTVELDVGGVTATDEVTVSGGETETAEPTVDVDDLPSGEIDATAAIDGDEATETVSVLAPAAFDVSITDVTNPVLDDEVLGVTVEVENFGDQTGTETVVLEADGDEVDDEDASVDGGNADEVTLEVDIPGEGIDVGTLDVAVEGQEDGATDAVDVEVLEAPEDPLFRLDDSDANALEIVQGADEIGPDDASDELDVETTVTNVGELSDTQTVELSVGGETVASQTVSLDGEGASETVDFDPVDAEDLDIGESTLTIATDDDVAEATVLVREAEQPVFAFENPDAVANAGPLSDGEDVTVTVENRGEVDGETDVAFAYATGVEVAIEQDATETVAPDAGESATATFTVDLDDGTQRAGTFDGVLDVTVANDDAGDARVVASADAEFGSLGDAVDAAGQDETVFVGADPALDSATIETDEVTVEAVTGAPITASSTVIEIGDAEGVEIDGLVLAADSGTPTGIEVTDEADDVTIRGVTFFADGGEWDPAIEDRGDGTLVRHVSVFGSGGGNGIDGTGTDLVVRDSEIRGVDNAVDLTAGASNATVQNVDLIGNDRGMFAAAGSHLMELNNIERNTAAIETVGTPSEVFVLAPDNWWGNAAGPVFGDDEDTADILSNVELDGVVFDSPTEDAEFTIDEFEEETLEVFEGETFEVSVTVENDGGTAGASDRQDVELLIDGETEDAETVDELDPGETETVDLSHQPTELGEFDVRVRSDDDDAETTLSVESEPTPTDPSPATGTGGGAAGPPAPTSPLTDRIGTSVDDAAPDEPGTTVDVGHANFASITFDDAEATGFVSVEVYDDVPTGAPALADDRPFFTGVTVDVPDEQADSPATLEFRVDADDVAAADADADDLVVLRAPDDATDYEELATDATEANGEIVVEAETPGFSTFVVSTTDDPEETPTPEPEEETPEPDEETPEPEEETPTPEDETPEEPGAFETPGFGVVVALVALLAAALIAARRRR